MVKKSMIAGLVLLGTLAPANSQNNIKIGVKGKEDKKIMIFNNLSMELRNLDQDMVELKSKMMKEEIKGSVMGEQIMMLSQKDVEIKKKLKKLEIELDYIEKVLNIGKDEV